MKWPWLSTSPGNRELTGEIDHLRRRSDVALDVGVAADGDDAIAADGDGLRLRHRVVDGDDLSVPQHHRGGLDGGRLIRRQQ